MQWFWMWLRGIGQFSETYPIGQAIHHNRYITEAYYESPTAYIHSPRTGNRAYDDRLLVESPNQVVFMAGFRRSSTVHWRQALHGESWN